MIAGEMIDALNGAARLWWPYVWHITWQGSLVAVAALCVTGLLRRWPSPLRYGLLVLALIKFAIPPTLALPTGIFTRAGPAFAPPPNASAIDEWVFERTLAADPASPISPDADRAPPVSGGAAAKEPADDAPPALAAAAPQAGVPSAAPHPADPSIDRGAWLMMLHVAGCLTIVLLTLRDLVVVRRIARQATVLTSGDLHDAFVALCHNMWLNRVPRLLVSPAPVSPMSFGIICPTVLLPAAIVRSLPVSEFQSVVAHELAHLRRADNWVNWIQVVLHGVWWFNPAVLLLNRAIRRTREDCCDDLVLSIGLSNDDAYCGALVHAAAQLTKPLPAGAMIGFAQRVHPIARRMQRLNDDQLSRFSRVPLPGLAALSLMCALVLPGLTRRSDAERGPAYRVSEPDSNGQSHSISVGNPKKYNVLGSLATDDNGLWLAAVCSRSSARGTTDGPWNAFLLRSRDDGVTWGGPDVLVPESAPTTQRITPSIAISESGLVLAVWAEGQLPPTASDLDLMWTTSRDAGLTWSTPKPLHPDSLNDHNMNEYCRVASAGYCRWVVLWNQHTGLGSVGPVDVLYSCSQDDGETWSVPRNLNVQGREAGEMYMEHGPCLAWDGAGLLVAAWYRTYYRGSRAELLIAESRDGGASWTSPRMITGIGRNTQVHGRTAPSICTDGRGNWMAAYSATMDETRHKGQNADIFVTTSLNHGAAWSKPVPVISYADSDSAEDTEPQLTFDPSGSWLVIWRTEGRTALGIDRDIVFALSRDNGASWTSPEPLCGQFQTDSQNDEGPSLVTSKVGTHVIAWNSSTTSTGLPVRSVKALRCGDPTVACAVPVILAPRSGLEARDSRDSVVATDCNGHWLAAWSVNRLGNGDTVEEYQVAVSSSQDNGSTWTAPRYWGSVSDGNVTSNITPVVSASKAGTWVAAWASTAHAGRGTGGDYQIRVVRSTDPAAEWSEPQPLIPPIGSDCTAALSPALAADDKGAWLIAWLARGSLGSSERAPDKVLVAGSVDDGVTWSLGQTVQLQDWHSARDDNAPSVSTDGRGTWLLAWHTVTMPPRGEDRKERDPEFCVMASRSEDNGVTWSPAVRVSSTGSSQKGAVVRLASVGGESWLAIWSSSVDVPEIGGNIEHIMAARSADAGRTWGPSTRLDSDALPHRSLSILPCLAGRCGGKWVAAWSSSSSDIGPLGSDYRIVSALSNDQGVTWMDGPSLSEFGTSYSRHAVFSSIACDYDEHWVTVWTASCGDGTEPRERIPCVSTSRDDGRTWSDPRPLVDRR